MLLAEAESCGLVGNYVIPPPFFILKQFDDFISLLVRKKNQIINFLLYTYIE
jgi:hypothetical protein